VLAYVAFGSLAFLSLALNLWQWLAARRFPLYQRLPSTPLLPPVTLLKPLKGVDEATEDCLRSWFRQDYAAPVQMLFAVGSREDPVCSIVHRLIGEHPGCNAQLVFCDSLVGTNAKVAKLVEVERLAAHEILVVSDADVRVPPDFLMNVTPFLSDPRTGLVNCFYQLANPSTPAMRWEAVAINSDFWSQVLQSRDLKPLDFALGAVMAFRRTQLAAIGGFQALINCLADDYQLGNRIAHSGFKIALAHNVVECWSGPMNWMAVWKHQLRWARTIRVCQPLPYFFSILSNPSFWPLLWVGMKPYPLPIAFALVCLALRVIGSADLQRRLTRRTVPVAFCLLPILKDLLQVGLWFLAFAGNRIEWRGVRMRLLRDGTLAPVQAPPR
jgi:ceramide glucosyltransferase